MPFTFSHPAIVLPLRYLPRKWFSLTGLIIGSMAPDFEYFIRMNIQSEYSHTIAGLFWFDLPLGILLAFLFHTIVRNSLYDNLPIGLKSRLVKFKSLNWNQYFKKNWLVVTISILIGAASHLFWDSFTHEHGYFVQLFSGLGNSIDLLNFQLPIYKILQHSSTLIGGLAIIFVLFNLPKDENIDRTINRKYWIILIGLTLTIIALRLLSGLNFKQYGHFIATSISAVMIALILTPFLIKVK